MHDLDVAKRVDGYLFFRIENTARGHRICGRDYVESCALRYRTDAHQAEYEAGYKRKTFLHCSVFLFMCSVRMALCHTVQRCYSNPEASPWSGGIGRAHLELLIAQPRGRVTSSRVQ